MKKMKKIQMKKISRRSDDEFNPTLAAMESEIKPKVLKTVNQSYKRI